MWLHRARHRAPRGTARPPVVQHLQGQSLEELVVHRRIDGFDLVDDGLDDLIARDVERDAGAVVVGQQLAEIEQGVDRAAAEAGAGRLSRSLAAHQLEATGQHRRRARLGCRMRSLGLASPAQGGEREYQRNQQLHFPSRVRAGEDASDDAAPRHAQYKYARSCCAEVTSAAVRSCPAVWPSPCDRCPGSPRPRCRAARPRGSRVPSAP